MNLCRELLRLEFFVSGHHEKIESGLLAIAEKEVLADQNVEHSVDLVAGFHIVRSRVIGALVGNLQVVQIIIGSDFPRETSCDVLRSAVI
jgi:hypothetical protein